MTRTKANLAYGLCRPQWWPDALAWRLGPSGPYDGKRVEFQACGYNYTFNPSIYGRFKGHQCAGHLPALVSEIAKYLEIDGHSVDLASALATTSCLEGGFDAIQTYDSARFSWGFIQFGGTGSLTGLVQRLEAECPEAYDRYFARNGIFVRNNRLFIRRPGGIFSGKQALDRLHDDPRLWKFFIQASHDSDVRHMQVRHAYENFYRSIANLYLPSHAQTLGDLVGGSDWGRAVIFDRAVNGGLVYAARLFKASAAQYNAESLPGPEFILTSARKLDAANERRWSALQKLVAAGKCEPGN